MNNTRIFSYFSHVHTDDTQLQERFLAGDMSAYEVLFHRYYPPLTGYAFKIVRDMDTARDLVQDLFVRIYQNRESIEIRFSFKAYCYQGVRNSCLKHLERHKNHEKHHSEIAAVSDQSVDRDMLVESEDEYRIYQAIETLPDQCKKIFWMNRMEGKKNGEIADVLGISKRTVETQISKALKILREKLLSWILLLWLLAGGMSVSWEFESESGVRGNSLRRDEASPRPEHEDFECVDFPRLTAANIKLPKISPQNSTESPQKAPQKIIQKNTQAAYVFDPACGSSIR